MKILFLDIETSPATAYIWRLWDKFIPVDSLVTPGNTLCWAASWLGSDKVMFDSVHQNSEEEMLAGVYELINQADAVVHYNGTKFDIPTLNQGFLKHGFTPPSPIKQIDLLKTVRSRFRLMSNKMDYVAKFLGLEGKKAHKGMQLWKDCMAGDDKSWKVMEAYNKQDVRILKKLYKKLLPWIKGHPNVSLYKGSDKLSCSTCGSHRIHHRGYAHTNAQVYKRYVCLNCGTWNKARLAEKLERKGVTVRDG